MKLFKLIRDVLKLIFGGILALGILELVFQMNPSLLIQGMSTILPVSPRLVLQEYLIHYSDADLFIWQKDLIEPIDPKNDKLEADVSFWTDEFGFPNESKGYRMVDLVILGRSFSMGAQASESWPGKLERTSGLSVLNLSQTGTGLARKLQQLELFGLPKEPKWVILEVLPALDIIGFTPEEDWLSISTVQPILQNILRKNQTNNFERDEYIFPMTIKTNQGEGDFLDFNYYISSLTVSSVEAEKSMDFVEYENTLLELSNVIKSAGSCLMLLYIPTKSEIFFPLINDPNILNPILPYLSAWELSATNNLVSNGRAPNSANHLIVNARERNGLVENLANAVGVPWIDPSGALEKSVLDGRSPYMVYDTHWNDLGHQIIARAVYEKLQSTTCP